MPVARLMYEPIMLGIYSWNPRSMVLGLESAGEEEGEDKGQEMISDGAQLNMDMMDYQDFFFFV
jgi:hypothetical protein